MKKVLFLVVSFFIVLNMASGAKIHGIVYDMDLEKVNNAVVEVNSVPKQRVLSVNGSYSFNLPSGNYTIAAYLDDGVTRQSSIENISVITEGDFVLDLFLFIDISSEESLLDDEIDISAPYSDNPTGPILATLAITSFVLLMIYLLKIKSRGVKNKGESENGPHAILVLLKRHGNRMTQKEIRKEIPLSEAKISLMISELESKGKIKRIKKGRGNIIVLQQ